jgi:hypothetical protein
MISTKNRLNIEIEKRVDNKIWNYELAKTVIEKYNKKYFFYNLTNVLCTTIAVILLIINISLIYNLSNDNSSSFTNIIINSDLSSEIINNY